MPVRYIIITRHTVVWYEQQRSVTLVDWCNEPPLVCNKPPLCVISPPSLV